jgi:hypothetical protein
MKSQIRLQSTRRTPDHFPPEATALDALGETGGPWPFDVTGPLQNIGAK